MKETFYVVEEEFSNGLENGFRVNKFDDLGEAFEFRDNRMKDVEMDWKDVPHSMDGNSKSIGIHMDNMSGNGFMWTVFDERRAMRSIEDKISFDGGVASVLDYINDKGENVPIDVLTLSLDEDAYPWTSMSTDGDDASLYKPFMLQLRPEDLENPGDNQIVDVYCRCVDNGNFDSVVIYTESLECIGDNVLANIFVHI